MFIIKQIKFVLFILFGFKIFEMNRIKTGCVKFRKMSCVSFHKF